VHIIDSHFHWWPRSVFDKLCQRGDFPKAAVNKRGGYDYRRRADSGQHLNSWAEWFDLDRQLEYFDSLGHQIDVVCSIGPFSVAFSDMPIAEGRDFALMWNEEMAGAQKKYPGRVWASAAVPLQGHERRDRRSRRRGRPARPHGRQSSRQRGRGRAHRCRAA
jgi:aminocarboxymuconate-semialdehyde decarboxylase